MLTASKDISPNKEGLQKYTSSKELEARTNFKIHLVIRIIKI